MNKEQYLKALRLNLKNMSKQETDDILQYYEEYFSDAGVENEDKVIEELGNPMALANKLKAEAVLDNMENESDGKKDNSNKLSNIWILVAAVCTSPIWFPVGITLAAVLFSVIVVLFAVLGSLAVAAVSVIIAGAASVLAGILAVPTGAGNVLLAVGTGLAAMGFGCLFTAIVFALMKLIYVIIVSICKAILRKKGDKNE